MSSVFFDVGCGAKTCILIRDDQANQGNVNDPDVDDWLLINGAYKNPTLLNNNIPSAGEPQLIIQTDSIVQRVPVDVCSSPGSPCGGLEQCSLRSLCVQRYTYHYLLSSKPGQHQHCPAIRAFKLPTACVCHAQVDSSRFGDKLV